MNENTIMSGVHMELTEALKQLVHEKVEKLYKHGEDIIRIRVELIFEAKKGAKELFCAKGHIEINGPDMIASETTEDLYKSIDLMVDKLDRMLRQRAHSIRDKRKHPHGVEIPANIPKVS